METINTDLLRGRVDVFILNSLSEHDGYGYDILDYIKNKTEGHYEMKQSSIYSVLKRLEKQGYIYSYQGDETNGGKRRYYALTDQGKEFLNNEKKEWDYTRTLINNLVSDKPFDLKDDIPPFKPSDLRPLTRRAREPFEEEAENSQDIKEEDKKEESVNNEQILDAAYEEASASTIIEEPVTSPTTIENEQKDINSEVLFDSTMARIKRESESKANESNTPIIEEKKYDYYAQATATPQERIAPANNYKDILGDLLLNNGQKVNNNSTINEEYENLDCKHINDLKAVLGKEGHNLKTYTPSSNKNYMKFIFDNKLNRDASILTYLFYVAMLLTVYLVKDSFAVNGVAVLVFGIIGIFVPAFFLIKYINCPTKRKKDNIRLNIIMPICLVTYLAFLVVNVIIGLLIPNGYSLNSPQIYAPSIVALFIPFFGLVYALLYKSEIYHQKNKD